MYRHQWQEHHNYYLAAAGLIWLLANPLTPQVAEAEVVRRRQRIHAVDHKEALLDFVDVRQQVLVQEVCRV